jgi:hypothetical protein
MRGLFPRIEACRARQKPGLVGAAALDVEESAGAVLVARRPVSAADVTGGLGLGTLELVTPVASEERTPYAPWSPSAHHVAESRNCRRIDPPTQQRRREHPLLTALPAAARRQPQYQLQPLTPRRSRNACLSLLQPKRKEEIMVRSVQNLAERAPRMVERRRTRRHCRRSSRSTMATPIPPTNEDRAGNTKSPQITQTTRRRTLNRSPTAAHPLAAPAFNSELLAVVGENEVTGLAPDPTTLIGKINCRGKVTKKITPGGWCEPYQTSLTKPGVGPARQSTRVQNKLFYTQGV